MSDASFQARRRAHAASVRADGADVAGSILTQWLAEGERRVALFLDVDGTVLDIADTPDAVVVPQPLRRALERLHERLDGALALVSGRPLTTLDRLFAPLVLPAAGGHGAEWRPRAGARHTSAVVHAIPSTVRERLLALAAAYPGVLAEDKGTSLALHYRAVPAAGEALGFALDGLLADPCATGLRVLPGKMVFEVIGAGCDKAQAVRRLLAEAPFAGRRPVFIGDDVTDEPALALMPRIGGLALSVGRLIAGAAAAFVDAAAVRAALIAAAGGEER